MTRTTAESNQRQRRPRKRGPRPQVAWKFHAPQIDRRWIKAAREMSRLTLSPAQTGFVSMYAIYGGFGAGDITAMMALRCTDGAAVSPLMLMHYTDELQRQAGLSGRAGIGTRAMALGAFLTRLGFWLIDTAGRNEDAKRAMVLRLAAPADNDEQQAGELVGFDIEDAPLAARGLPAPELQLVAAACYCRRFGAPEIIGALDLTRGQHRSFRAFQLWCQRLWKRVGRQGVKFHARPQAVARLLRSYLDTLDESLCACVIAGMQHAAGIGADREVAG